MTLTSVIKLALVEQNITKHMNDFHRGIEKAIITQVFAPAKLVEVEQLVKAHRQKIENCILETKKQVERINQLFEEAAKGKWSQQLQQNIQYYMQQYDRL